MQLSLFEDKKFRALTKRYLSVRNICRHQATQRA